MTDHSFPKSERLCSRRDIDRLFREGRGVRRGFLSLRWLIEPAAPSEGSIRILISVPKRRVSKAVDRNRLKRQIREVYRLNKAALPDVNATGHRILLAVIYGGQPRVRYASLRNTYLRALESLRDDFILRSQNEELNKN